MNISIQFGGRLRDFKFNEIAHRKITSLIFDDIAKGYAATEQEINACTITATFYGGLLGAYYVERKELDFTFNDIAEWLDKANELAIQKVCNCYAETQRYKDFIDKFKIVQEDVKVEKKNTRKKK